METERLMLSDNGMVALDDHYVRYIELGGKIDEDSFRGVWAKASVITSLDRVLVGQAENIARIAGFSLSNGENLDDITIFYGVLRSDYNPVPEFHHSQMGDQRLFAEGLKMLDHPDLLERVVQAYPRISFF